jgi:hypothetical protein
VLLESTGRNGAHVTRLSGTRGTLLFRYLQQKRIRRKAGHLNERKRTAVVMHVALHVGVGAIYSRRECGEPKGYL